MTLTSAPTAASAPTEEEEEGQASEEGTVLRSEFKGVTFKKYGFLSKTHIFKVK